MGVYIHSLISAVAASPWTAGRPPAAPSSCRHLSLGQWNSIHTPKTQECSSKLRETRMGPFAVPHRGMEKRVCWWPWQRCGQETLGLQRQHWGSHCCDQEHLLLGSPKGYQKNRNNIHFTWHWQRLKQEDHKFKQSLDNLVL